LEEERDVSITSHIATSNAALFLLHAALWLEEFLFLCFVVVRDETVRML
jgi:hypothetical protein